MDKDFMEKKVWESQKEMLKSKNYILRIASMKSVDYLKKYHKKEFINSVIIPYIIENTQNDKIPNVKFSACEVLASLVIFVNKEELIKKNVEDFICKFINDKDEDVVFFSKKAFDELQK